MKTVPTLFATIVLSAGLLVATGANATLVPALGGQVINDTDLNITWLADANYAKTSGYDADGLMTWSQAQGWIASLNTANYLGYHDWRLPTTGPVNGSAFNYGISYNGSTDVGENVSEQGTAYAGSKGSEMAHLYYNSLNDKDYCNPITSTASSCAGPQAGWGLTNTGPFINLQSDLYWSGTEYAPYAYGAWSFNTYGGGQEADWKGYGMFALAVRPGQVAAVPVPAAVWLLGSGLLGLVGVARRKAA